MNTHNFTLVGCDTDSILFCKPDQKPFTVDEQEALINEINALSGEFITWENDGYFKRVVVVKKKNYVLEDYKGNVTIKGSGLKGTMKEKALQRFMSELIGLLLKDRKDHVFSLYNRYALEIRDLADISEWCFKKTVTKSVLNPERTNESRVLDAIGSKSVSEGDKLYLFFKTDTELCLRDDFTGVYCFDTLYSKLHSTLSIFENLLDVKLFPDYSLKRNKELI